MSFFSRLRGKSPPPAATTPAAQPKAAPAPPKPDHAARAREEEAAVAQAIAAGDAQAIAKWVLEGSSHRVRQLAAQAVTDPEQLRELIRATRGGNDKNVYRILTATRDAQLAVERREQQRRAELDTAAAAIARHAERHYDALFEATLTQLDARWQALAADATPEMQRAVTQQLATARATVDQHRAAAEQARRENEAQAQAAAEARRQREAEAQAAAEAAAEQAAEARRQREAAEQAAKEKREADESEVRHLIGLLRQAQAAIDHGGTARAARFRDTIKEKLPSAPAGLVPPWFERKLHELDARIEEMKDWKTFTVVPKRGELLQRMQGLIGADMSPEELARQIRRLREEWRTLNRGAGDDTSAEWQQFNDAAERAYAPCREHFAKQAELRKENQAKREALLERLAAYAERLCDAKPTAPNSGTDLCGQPATDLAAEPTEPTTGTAVPTAEPPNWRAVQQTLAEARREWQSYAPVDPAVLPDLQARFRHVMDALHSRLDAEYDRNIEAKRRLIARAEALAKLDDTRQAIDEAKRLQRDWKTVGVVPRAKDHALWEEFRHHCDAVFQRSAQEHAAHTAALESQQARAVALCEELERIAALTGDPLTTALHTLPALRTEFDALDLPRATARALYQRFSKANDLCRDAQRRHKAEEAQRGWTELFDAAAQLRAYALAKALQQQPGEEVDQLKSAAEAAINGLERAPKAGRAVLEQQLAKIAAQDPAAAGNELASGESKLRLLCIRAELITEQPTPPEDQERRREYQMQRLVQAMGRGERTAPGDLDALALEWIAVVPVESAVHDALFERFRRCRNARHPRP